MARRPVKKGDSVTADALRGLLRSCRLRLSAHSVVLFDELVALRRAQAALCGGHGAGVHAAAKAAMYLPLLDEWRRLAADTLNAEAEAGLPKTDAARRQLGARVRVGPFGSMEHEIRALVRVVYPVRVERVAAHQRRGRPTREYSRTYGDPAQWRLSLALLSDAARLLYPYVLAAPLRKDSRW